MKRTQKLALCIILPLFAVAALGVLGVFSEASDQPFFALKEKLFGIYKDSIYAQTTTADHAFIEVTNPSALKYGWRDISSPWDYYRNRYLNASLFYLKGPVASSKIPPPNEIVSIPHYWDEAKGSATYHTRIIGLKSNTTYATYLYDKFSTAGEIICNGKYTYSEGYCSSDWTKTICGRNMDIVYLKTDSLGMLDIVMRCSNKVYRTGGIYYHLKLAEQSYVENWYMKTFVIRLLFIGALFVIFLYQLALFFFNKYERSYLYLSLFSFFAMQRLMFASFSIVSIIIPHIPYALSLKLEHMPIYLCGLCYFLYMLEYSGRKFLKPVPVVFSSFGGLLFIANAVLPLSIENYLVPAYQVYTLVCGLSGFYLTFAKNSVGKNSLNAIDFISLLVLLVGTVHDICVMYALPVIAPDTEMVMYSFIIFIILQSMNTAWIQNKLSKNLKALSLDMEKANTASYRFVPQQFLKLLGKTDICTVRAKDHCTQKVALINTDVRHFTTISEGLDGKTVFNLLNQYMAYVTPIIRYYNGFIEKVMGDGIIAVFADSADASDSADRAMLCALEMQEAMVLLRSYLKKENLPEIEIGIGVHCGAVVLGTVGNEKRMSEVVVSPIVGEVMAIESYHKVCGVSVIASEEVVENLNEKKIFHATEIEQKKETPCKGYNGRLYSVEKSVEF